jgi:hypothetical protein
MNEDLRKLADESPFEDIEEPSVRPYRPRADFLGLTPAQRFVIALMLLLITCLLGAFTLLVTEKVVLPFL